MAIVINTSPTNNASVNNEMLFVTYEATKANDEVTYPDYTYVLDLYVDSVFVGRIKSRPDPVNKRGIFNVAPLLRSSASYGLKANYTNATETYTIKVNYTVKLGEEYGGTLYTNLVVDSTSREAYESYAVRPFDSPDVEDDIFGSKASNMSDTIFNYKTEKWQLIPYVSNVSGVANWDFKFFDPAGVQVGATVVISTAGYAAKTLLQANVGFVKMAALLSTPQKESVDYATVTAASNDIATTIRYQCSKFTPKVLAWLNPYGGYDSYQFGMVNKKSVEVSRKEFAQLNYRINASGETSYSADGVFYGSKKGFAATIKTVMRMTSHLLVADEYTWLADMFKSPDVYMYDSVLDKFFPVVITETNYEYRNYANSRLTPLEFTVEYSDTNNAQYL